MVSNNSVKNDYCNWIKVRTFRFEGIQPSRAKECWDRSVIPQHCWFWQLSDVCSWIKASRQRQSAEKVNLLWLATDNKLIRLYSQNAFRQSTMRKVDLNQIMQMALGKCVFLGYVSLSPLVRTLLTLESHLNMEKYCPFGRKLRFEVRKMLRYECLCLPQICMLKSSCPMCWD